ncbi:MAG: LytR/AlgR family response regulator transcription factor [Bacilli bacterium]
MLNFIICDDSKEFRDNLQKTIDSYMMKLDMDYKTYEYADYNKEFRNVVKSDIGFKIYFLDIRMGEASGIDAARMIREEFDDWSSIIIVVTSFSEYRYEALGNRLYLLDFVSKVDGCEKRIEENIKRALKNYNNTEKSITYELNHVIKRIEYRHILYIEKEQDSKRCIIKTIYGDQLIRKNLSEVEKMLDRTFMKVHRSLIVNLDLLKEFNVSENKLTFKNGESIYLVARKYKKELIDRVVS